MKALREYIAAARGRPLRYGRHDCVTFAGRWAEAQTGRQIVPAYSSLKAGVALLADDPLPARLAREFRRVAPLQAQPGDLALLPSDAALPALGVVAHGGFIACFTGREIGLVPLTAATDCYRVTAA